MMWICFFAQQNPNPPSNINDISKTSKTFKKHFFDALSNRAVEQYEKAIKNLEACLKLNHTLPVLYYELAQNEISLRFYDSAKNNLKKALELDPNNIEILKSLSETHFILKNFDERIAILKKLSKINPKYQYNLARTYSFTQQYEKALTVLNEYQKKYGYDSRIESFKNQIYASSKNRKFIITDLEKTIDKNPKNEKAYLQLISLYKKNNQESKYTETIERLKQAAPNTPMLEYFNFQNYLNSGDTLKATEAMEKITSGGSFSQNIKTKVLNDFNNFKAQRANTTPATNSVTKKNINKDLEPLFKLSTINFNQGNTESLLKAYQNNLKTDSNNYDLIKNTLLLQMHQEKWSNAKKLIETGIEKHPSQPFLYLIKGTILAQENKHNNAITNFKDGLDYIVDDLELERTLYFKLAKSYNSNGELEKAKKYQEKGEKIELSN